MLQTSLDCIVGVAEQQETARNVIHAARLHHDGYGVPDSKVDNMFVAIRDTFRDILDERWTPEMEAAWAALLIELSSRAS